MTKKQPKKEISLAESDKNLHGNAIEFPWGEFDAFLMSDPTKVYCCDYFGISDTYIDNKIKDKFGLTFTEYKALRLQDVITKIKSAMMSKAMSGDVSAGKYVLSNISDWMEKKEVAIEEVTDRDLMEAVQALIESKKQ